MEEFEERKRLKRLIVYSVLAAGCYFLMFVVLFTSGYDNLGYGTINNTIVTWLMFICVVLTTTALIKGCVLRTPKNGITHWKRIGLFTLIVWSAAITLFAVTAIAPAVGAILPSIVVIVPSLVWLPIWMAVNAIRGARNPERLSPIRVRGKAASTIEPTPGDQAPTTPPQGTSDSTTASEGEKTPPAQTISEVRAGASLDVVRKRKWVSGWIIGVIASGLLLVGVTITLVILFAGETPEQTTEQQAELLAIKACGIIETTDEETGEKELIFTGKMEGLWSATDRVEGLEELRDTVGEKAKYAARATRIDDYWAPLANDLQTRFEFVSKIVTLREASGLPLYALRVDQETDFYDRYLDEVPEPNIYNEALNRWELQCEALHDTLNERE